MKKIISFIVIIGLIAGGYLYRNELSTGLDKLKASILNTKIARDAEETTQDSTLVSTIQVQKNQKSYVIVLGTVKAQTQLKVYPAVSGQVTKIYVKDGQKVKKGQILLDIGGANNTKHSTLSQLEIAQNNYNTAAEAYAQAINGNKVAYNVAKIQLQSAKNQYDATGLDIQSIDNNIDTSSKGADLLNEILDLTQDKNSNDLDKLQDVIDNLNDTEDSLDTAKYELQTQLDRLNLDTSLDPQTKQDNINKLVTAITDTDKKISDLEKQIDTSNSAYDSAELGTQMAEDQLQIQLNQSETAAENLEITKESTAKKLGYNDLTYDPLRLAHQNFIGTQIKNYLTLVQSQSQLTLAEINLEMMENQASGLKVKAQTDGVIAGITANEGDMVSPQLPVLQLIGNKNYEAEIYVDVDTAKKISQSSKSEIKIDNKYVQAKIKTISPLADPISKLVKITFSLPSADFSVNESAEMRITIVNIGTSVNTFFIPLDSIIIGTEEQYVYILEDGKAKKNTITVEDITGDNAKISDGLSYKDRVIVDGAKTIIDGQNVYTKIPRKIANNGNQ